MRDVIRRICVCLFVVSFVFSGATWAACIEVPVTPTAAVSHTHHGAAADQSARQHDHGGQLAAAPDQGPVPDHAPVVKCCSFAPAFSLAPGVSATPINFSVAAISFRIAERDLTGFVVALDPGIPKHIV